MLMFRTGKALVKKNFNNNWKNNPIFFYSTVSEKLVREKGMKRNHMTSLQVIQRLFLKRYEESYFTF